MACVVLTEHLTTGPQVVLPVIILSPSLNYHAAQLRLEKTCHRQPMSFALSTVFAVLLLVEHFAVHGAA